MVERERGEDLTVCLDTSFRVQFYGFASGTLTGKTLYADICDDKHVKIAQFSFENQTDTSFDIILTDIEKAKLLPDKTYFYDLLTKDNTSDFVEKLWNGCVFTEETLTKIQ